VSRSIVTLAPLVGLALLSACAPKVPPLHSPASVDAFCGSKEARNTGIASVVSSTDDRLLDEHVTDGEGPCARATA
jgi:hypothetical protein